MPKRLKFRSLFMKDGEEFAVKRTDAGNFNLWHITEEHTKVYTFVPVPGKYDTFSCWEERLCKELLADITSDHPSVTVVRYAIDDTHVFPIDADPKDWPIPKVPPSPVMNEQQKEEYARHLAKKKEKEKLS